VPAIVARKVDVRDRLQLPRGSFVRSMIVRTREVNFRRSPTGPRVTPPAQANRPGCGAAASCHRRQAVFVVGRHLHTHDSGVGIRAYRDLSRPEAWSYWKDQYFSPTMTSSLVTSANFQWRGPRPVCVIHHREKSAPPPRPGSATGSPKPVSRQVDTVFDVLPGR